MGVEEEMQVILQVLVEARLSGHRS